ncbi:hypothetical protein AB6G07_17640 [Providencia stuartii]|nr:MULTISPECIES: hypothetical protein [Providencia]
MSNALTEIAALLQASNKKVLLILLVCFLKNDGFKLQGEANA